ELVYFLDDLEAVAVVTDAELAPHVMAVLTRLRTRPGVVSVGPAGAGGGVLVVGNGGRRGNSTPGASPLLHPYTPGSTGTPKRVVRTNGALLAEMEALRTTFGIDERDRFLGATPFSHVNGLVRTMMASLHVSATLYPVAQFLRREVLDRITRERMTFFGGVPQMFVLLSQTPPRGEVDLSSLRVVFSSSAPLT